MNKTIYFLLSMFLVGLLVHLITLKSCVRDEKEFLNKIDSKEDSLSKLNYEAFESSEKVFLLDKEDSFSREIYHHDYAKVAKRQKDIESYYVDNDEDTLKISLDSLVYMVGPGDVLRRYYGYSFQEKRIYLLLAEMKRSHTAYDSLSSEYSTLYTLFEKQNAVANEVVGLSKSMAKRKKNSLFVLTAGVGYGVAFTGGKIYPSPLVSVGVGINLAELLRRAVWWRTLL